MVLDGFAHGIAEGWWMFFDTFWALVLGFGLSGAVQAFVSRAQMQAALGDHRPKTLAKASFLGAVSSSCSYAASALAKSLFARGADFTASMIFMIASTNLVVELGIVIWLLVGWQFAAAEFVGGAVMIALLGFVLPRVIPRQWTDEAQRRLSDESHPPSPSVSQPLDAQAPPTSPRWQERARTRAGWSDASGYTISDLTMLRRELIVGFVVGGFASALVPTWFWRSLFVTGHGFWSSLQNVVLGPFLALISFVCSIGNVPIAAALWRGGISFGGVISFIFADLITLPLLLIYRKYFGTAITLRLLAAFWFAMSSASLATEYLVRAAHLLPKVGAHIVPLTHAGANYTTVLNVIAAIGFGVLYWLYRTRTAGANSSSDDATVDRYASTDRYAKDPVCGMQVEKALAPARLQVGSQTVYFCSDHCSAKFAAENSHATRS
ncbi:MAG TPA: permease [Acidothermaceae bacterium]